MKIYWGYLIGSILSGISAGLLSANYHPLTSVLGTGLLVTLCIYAALYFIENEASCDCE